MSRSDQVIRIGVQGVALGAVAWASLALALRFANQLFLARHDPTADFASEPTLAEVVVPVLVLAGGLWLQHRSDQLTARLRRMLG